MSLVAFWLLCFGDFLFCFVTPQANHYQFFCLYLAIPMFVCWGVSTALGVALQYKITAKNLNNGSSILQFCNCCGRPQPDR